jgi:hypothetical protein
LIIELQRGLQLYERGGWPKGPAESEHDSRGQLGENPAQQARLIKG